MISNLGRVMAVLTAMASAAFMTFAVARYSTIPDWAAEARTLDGFVVSRTEGETPSWTASTRRTQESVGTSTNMADVLEKMYQRAKTDVDQQVQDLQARVPDLQQKLAAAQSSVEEDDKAVDTKVEAMIARLNEMNQEVDRLTEDIEREKASAQTIQEERERRRGDVFRLREQVGEINADQFRAARLQEQLTDMIRRAEGHVVKLQARNQELRESVN
ncbi:MAG: hypothetical protein KDA78_02355 [Planctomycetaceae bacterium]|nr:hypothetical protein [Planctomycetaceae bacterium]